MRTWIKNFLADDKGQDMIEYSLILVLIGTVALIFLSGLGLSISGIVSKVGFKLETVSDFFNENATFRYVAVVVRKF